MVKFALFALTKAKFVKFGVLNIQTHYQKVLRTYFVSWGNNKNKNQSRNLLRENPVRAKTDQ